MKRGVPSGTPLRNKTIMKSNNTRKIYFTPFFESRVPFVAPWRALNLGLVLQMTYLVPLRLTIWQSEWRRLADAREDKTLITKIS